MDLIIIISKVGMVLDNVKLLGGKMSTGKKKPKEIKFTLSSAPGRAVFGPINKYVTNVRDVLFDDSRIIFFLQKS